MWIASRLWYPSRIELWRMLVVTSRRWERREVGVYIKKMGKRLAKAWLLKDRTVIHCRFDLSIQQVKLRNQ